MAQTTTWSLPYPEAGDHTRLWEHYQALAEAVDALLVDVEVFSSNVTADSAGRIAVAITGRTQPPLVAIAQYSAGSTALTIQNDNDYPHTAAQLRFRAYQGTTAWTGGGLSRFHVIAIYPPNSKG